jgi:selenide,water dikinase
MVECAGCAAKLGPSHLAELLQTLPASKHDDLIIGFETRDDAAVYRINDDFALVQTMDFFPPIVDDPYDYGCIAAANALSDVYAMGGTPLTAMNICCFDPETAEPEIWSKVLQGMADKVREAGAVTVGGHTVVDRQPKFGLSVTGSVDPRRVFSNASARPGDALYLSKPLGTGIITTAAKFDDCPEDALFEAIRSMKTLNEHAARTAWNAGAECATDITGFGLAGHLSHIARASDVSIVVDSASLPLLPHVETLVEKNHITGGSKKNLAYLTELLQFEDSVPRWLRELVIDPQTSGGLVVASSTALSDMIAIGSVEAGRPKIKIV